jgi:hypothetical protein
VSASFRLRNISIDDHCSTVTPVVSLPHDSVTVLLLKPLPMASRTRRQWELVMSGLSYILKRSPVTYVVKTRMTRSAGTRFSP